MKTIVLLLAMAFFSATAAAADGAKVQPIDKNGKPMGEPITLPDCKSCTVRQVGPNSYMIKVPDHVKVKVEKTVEKTTPK